MSDNFPKYRLHKTLSNPFEREEEQNQKEPKRIIFLSVEGTVTEPQYFNCLNRRLKQYDDTVFKIEVLERKRADGHSAPKYVIELLNEYMDILSEGPMPKPWITRLNKKYTNEEIEQSIYNPLSLQKDVITAIYDELIDGGVNLAYRKYLKAIGEGSNTTNDRDHHF